MRSYSIIDQLKPAAPKMRELADIDTVAIHRVGIDKSSGITLGYSAKDICRHFTGENESYKEISKATGGQVPYTFIIGGAHGPDAEEYNGKIWQTASIRSVSAHAKRWNTRALGIALVGDFRFDPPSRKQLESLVDLVSMLCIGLNVDPDHVRGHMELQGASSNPNKQCPGKLLHMESLRYDVKVMMKELGNSILHGSGVEF